MDSFYNTVLMVALILLILGLSYAGYLLYYYGYAEETWPKSRGACPDTWIEMGKDAEDRQRCVLSLNSPNLGKDDFASTNPSGIAYNSVDTHTVYTHDAGSGMFTFESLPKCDLKAWADLNEISWDGITNYNNC